MTEGTNKASEEAAMRIVLRQLAPDLCKMFIHYGIEWLETPTNLYLAARFAENVDISLPESAIVTMNSTVTKRQEHFPKGKSEHIDSLYDMFPYMSELFVEKAGEWGLSMYDLFLTARYKGENKESPEETLGIALHTKKSIEPKRMHKIG